MQFLALAPPLGITPSPGILVPPAGLMMLPTQVSPAPQDMTTQEVLTRPERTLGKHNIIISGEAGF